MLKRRLAMFFSLALLLSSLSVAEAGPASDPDSLSATSIPHYRRLNNFATTTPTGYSPQRIRHAYGIDQIANHGGGQIVAIVDAFDDPNIAADLGVFNTQFSLTQMNGTPGHAACTVAAGPHPCFEKQFSNGLPPTDTGWASEIALDVEWSHVIAPAADILLVEAKSNSNADLYAAVDVASASGAHVVSMSWGGREPFNASSTDVHFRKSGVTFFASSGDSGNGASYPATSPNVVSVGGTSLKLDASSNVVAETAWSGSGGGISARETEPGYQTSFGITTSTGKRPFPDVSYNANPASGVPVYDSFGVGGWGQFGGTSAGSPQWAAIVALVDQIRAAGPLSSNSLVSSAEYSAAVGANYALNYRDIVAGTNGSCGAVCSTNVGYDFVTGLGSPIANKLIPFLATH
uniref:Peptidase S8/S53 n=1 Tax=uncultured bacterium F25-01 TaxID=1191433 RepID=I3VIF0_9BACT|nr:peptidase S8/S53 [uncultured bacterium F25-01]